MRRRQKREASLTDRIEVRVRFSEVDALQIVWHGEYVKYIEDGREAFGKRYGIGYMDMKDEGFAAPIVKLDLDYKLSLTFNEQAIVETRYIPCDAAKIQFDYTVFRKSDNAVVAEASTVQVFTHLDTGILELNNPDFYLKWKEKWNIR
ncbi:MAG: acyl-CoA thioesterase [Bacteroidia bacterium]|nr:acyl-CoA thioesterase [Bacteroidia bacterium]